MSRKPEQLAEALANQTRIIIVTIQTFPALFDALDKYPKLESLNDLFGAEVTDENKLTFANGIATRLSQDEEVMAQVNSHTPYQVMHGVFPKRAGTAR